MATGGAKLVFGTQADVTGITKVTTSIRQLEGAAKKAHIQMQKGSKAAEVEFKRLSVEILKAKAATDSFKVSMKQVSKSTSLGSRAMKGFRDNSAQAGFAIDDLIGVAAGGNFTIDAWSRGIAASANNMSVMLMFLGPLGILLPSVIAMLVKLGTTAFKASEAQGDLAEKVDGTNDALEEQKNRLKEVIAETIKLRKEQERLRGKTATSQKIDEIKDDNFRVDSLLAAETKQVENQEAKLATRQSRIDAAQKKFAGARTVGEIAARDAVIDPLVADRTRLAKDIKARQDKIDVLEKTRKANDSLIKNLLIVKAAKEKRDVFENLPTSLRGNKGLESIARRKVDTKEDPLALEKLQNRGVGNLLNIAAAAGPGGIIDAFSKKPDLKPLDPLAGKKFDVRDLQAEAAPLQARQREITGNIREQGGRTRTSQAKEQAEIAGKLTDINAKLAKLQQEIAADELARAKAKHAKEEARRKRTAGGAAGA